MNFAVGVDIGGTKVAIGIVDENGFIHEQTKINTDLNIPPVEMLNKIAQAIEQLVYMAEIDWPNILGIGIGAPGPLDIKNGCISCPPNLPSWVDIPVVNFFEKQFLLPVHLENDASAAALAEKWMGSAQENDHFIYLTISTGIGAGVYSHRQLITGSNGNTGDVGHMVIDPSFGTCTCGQEGCWEWIASGTSISRQGSELLGRPVTTKEVFELYNGNDLTIINMVDRIFRRIGIGCVSLINIFDPEKLVIGGGVSQVGEPLFTAIREYVNNYALNPAGRNTEIVPSSLNQNTGLIGAAALIFHK